MGRRKGMGSHHSAAADTTSWITPKWLLGVLGGFYLDPCACTPQPWPCAKYQYTEADDGLGKDWSDRVWLNPPYGREAEKWMRKLADHGNGIALIFARTETKMFFDQVWNRANAVLFIRGRLRFCRPDGTEGRYEGGAPSVLVAYGRKNAVVLEDVADDEIPGHFVRLNPRE